MQDSAVTPSQGANEGYRPLSGLAIGGLIFSGIFSVLLAISIAVGLTQGAPVFYPAPILIIPFAGFFISYIAKNQIANSEGTREGTRLANYGMWLALFSGLGYFAYYYVTGLALASQAGDFLLASPEGFFPLLQKAQNDRVALNKAFLMTVAPADRSTAKPDQLEAFRKQYDNSPDGSPGAISKFREDGLVRTILRTKEGLKIEPLEVKEWKYENKSYSVTRHVRVSSPELIMDAGLVAQSVDGEAGQARRWYLALEKTQHFRLTLTEFGEKLRILRGVAHRAAEEVIKGWSAGQSAPFSKISNTKWEELNLPTNKVDAAKEFVTKTMESAEANRFFMSVMPEEMGGEWEKLEDGRFAFPFPFRLNFPQAQEIPRAFGFEGRLKFVSDRKIDFNNLPSAAEARWSAEGVEIIRAVRSPTTGFK